VICSVSAIACKTDFDQGVKGASACGLKVWTSVESHLVDPGGQLEGRIEEIGTAAVSVCGANVVSLEGLQALPRRQCLRYHGPSLACVTGLVHD
jgi:hypothetical protein